MRELNAKKRIECGRHFMYLYQFGMGVLYGVASKIVYVLHFCAVDITLATRALLPMRHTANLNKYLCFCRLYI